MIKEDGLPIGLGFGLAMNEEAMNNFAAMTEDEKRRVVEAARGMQTKQEMHRLVKNIADLGKWS